MIAFFLGVILGVVFGLDDLVVGGLNARDLLDDRADALGVTTGGDKGDAELTQVLADETAGVSADSVDDDWLCCTHVDSHSHRAINGQRHTVDKGGLLGEEEGDTVGDVVLGGEATGGS